MSRAAFRKECVERDGGECLVPLCDEHVTADPEGPGEVHHIIERKLWENGGYFPDNGACVCNEHHRMAEQNIIPPQAFYRWANIESPIYPDGLNEDCDKWGEPLDTPPWQEHRKYIKYPSTRHLPWSHERDDDDTAHEQVDCFLGYPLVATIKMDGANAQLVKDSENPVRARNGRHADKQHFDMCKQMYWDNNLYEDIPQHLQIFGEWLYAKHSIHYGCDCKEPCDDIGPALRDYFQVFGMFDTRYNLFLGWQETRIIANRLGLTMVPPAPPVYQFGEYDNRQEFWDLAYDLSEKVVEDGHEGIVIRSRAPFHYGQIEQRLGKYVRPNHVEDGATHWSHRPLVQNVHQE